MSQKPGSLGLASTPLSSSLILVTTVHMLVGSLAHTLWLLQGNQSLFRYFFDYEDPLFLVFLTGLEFSVACLAWKQFAPGQLLRRAWLLIAIAAGCHVVGMMLSHILSADSPINPIYAFNAGGYKATQAVLLQLGLFIGGPVHMAVLAAGLFLALRLYKKLGLRGSIRAIDWVILGVVVAYTLRVAYVVIRLQLGAPRPPHRLVAMNWANDPLLCVLLFQAFSLRKSVAPLGWGYVEKCWGAYVVAIFATSLGSMGMWAVNFGILPYPESAALWYLWPLVYAAYALGPIYQIEAAHVAEARLRVFSPQLPVEGPA